MNRRSVGFGLAATGGLLAGGGLYWRRSEHGTGGVWGMEFEAIPPAPAPVRLVPGRPLLLNFWATWCVPCVTEMPLLDRFASDQASTWRVLALAVDEKDAVVRFVRERGLNVSVALAGLAGIGVSRELGNRLGALPFTCVFGASGRAQDHHLGAVDNARLQRWTESVK